jgi:protein tyrosine phosphatase type 4A
VTKLVRVCDPSYATDLLTTNNIEVHDWPYPDGDPPPQEVIDGWLGLVDETFNGSTPGCIAVHCVAGLGR